MKRRNLLATLARIGEAGLCTAVTLGIRSSPGLAETEESSPTMNREGKITIDNFAFSPNQLIVVAGTHVTWTNRDDIPHTIVSRDDPRKMRSPPLDTGDTFTFIFDAPGVYNYFCSLHPHMQGSVVVQ